MSLPLLPLLTGDDHLDLATVIQWIYTFIKLFPNAVGEAIDPTKGQGGSGALSVTEGPTGITYTSSSKLSLDNTLVGAIQIDYTLPDRAIGIIIQYKESTSDVFKTSFASISPQSLINLNIGIDYDIQIAGYSANGDIGPYSPLTSVLIPTDAATVLPPINLTILLSNQTVTLQWTAPTGIQPIRYGIQRAANSTFTTDVFNTTIDSTTLMDTLTSGGTYYYRVRSVDSIGGFSAYTSSVNITLALFTKGSVVFVGDNGVLAQDNSHVFYDIVNKRIGIGTNVPTVVIDIVKEWSGVNPGNLLISETSYADQSRITLRRANGTAASPAQVILGETLGNINFRGHDGTNFSIGARTAIGATALENFTPTQQGTSMQFYTTPVGGTGLALAITMDGSGFLGVGTPSPTTMLDVNNNIIRLRTAKTPATSGAAGNQGDIAWDGTYFYICVNTNTWHRVQHATW